MIRKTDGKWVLFTHDGSKRLGVHATHAEAVAQEQAIESSKHRRSAARSLHLRGALGQIRVAQFEGRDHLVIPVIALMEGVIHAINAETPEFVPYRTLATAPQSWNGRPLVLGHPVRNGMQISANDHGVLEAQSFGTIFNARLEGKKLLMDAWIDPQKVQKIGGMKMLERLRRGDMCEVSVGAFVTTAETAGAYNGKPYKAVWQTIVPDHLAFLPYGVGACSIEMGCGAHRAAQSTIRAAARSENAPPQHLAFRALLNSIDVRALAKDQPDKGEHPFTYCMEVVVPAIEDKQGTMDDPHAFCGWWKADREFTAAQAAPILHLVTAQEFRAVGGPGSGQFGHQGAAGVAAGPKAPADPKTPVDTAGPPTPAKPVSKAGKPIKKGDLVKHQGKLYKVSNTTGAAAAGGIQVPASKLVHASRLEILGGPGSGWFGHAGHTPGAAATPGTKHTGGYPQSRRDATLFAQKASEHANRTGLMVDHHVAAAAHTVARNYHKANGDRQMAQEHQIAIDHHRNAASRVLPRAATRRSS